MYCSNFDSVVAHVVKRAAFRDFIWVTDTSWALIHVLLFEAADPVSNHWNTHNNECVLLHLIAKKKKRKENDSYSNNVGKEKTNVKEESSNI